METPKKSAPKAKAQERMKAAEEARIAAEEAAKAEAEAQAMVMLAEAQAEANRLLAESLTGNLLEKMYYEKWDGKLPYIYGGDNTPIIQMP